MVKTSFVKSWNKSTQPRKQRKYRYNAPLHLKRKFLHIHLLPALREKYGIRNVQVKKGDKAKVMRGKFAKKEGKVERVDLKNGKVYIVGIEMIKKEGTKLPISLTPSNLMIIDLDLSDKKRKEKIERNLKSEKAKTKFEKTEKTEIKKESTKTEEKK